jgi:hypothetical protein
MNRNERDDHGGHDDSEKGDSFKVERHIYLDYLSYRWMEAVRVVFDTARRNDDTA